MPNPCEGGVSGHVTEPVKLVRAVMMMLAMAGIAAVSVPMSAQSASGVSQSSSTMDPAIQRNVDEWIQQGRGVADDWSHHRLVYSDAGTMQEATANGTFEHWLKVSNEPRYTMQVIRRARNAASAEGTDATLSVAASAMSAARPGGHGARLAALPQGTKLDKDWSMDLGGGTASTLSGTVSSNGATGSSTVTVDGVTLDASAPVAASATGTFTGSPGAGQGVTIRNGSNALSLVTNATTSTAIGTVSAAPTSTVAPTITVTNSAGSPANTLSLTTNGTGATSTVTVSGSGPGNNQTITITSGSNTVTLTLSGSASTPGTGTNYVQQYRRCEWRHARHRVDYLHVRGVALGIFRLGIYGFAVLLPKYDLALCVVGGHRGQHRAGYLCGDHE